MHDAETAGQLSSNHEGVELLDRVEIAPSLAPDASIIWLHGLGADGHDFEPIVPHLSWPGAPGIRWVFPHAPERAVTINGGMRMRAWYDILGFDTSRGQDQSGIETSIAQVNRLIDREIEHGVSASRIVMAGFSQGGAIAIEVVRRRPQRMGGLIALSTYLLNPAAFAVQTDKAHSDLPVFFAHGTQDPVVPFSWGEQGAHTLRNAGYSVDWHAYGIQHAVSPPEIADITFWLQQRLG